MAILLPVRLQSFFDTAPGSVTSTLGSVTFVPDRLYVFAYEIDRAAPGDLTTGFNFTHGVADRTTSWKCEIATTFGSPRAMAVYTYTSLYAETCNLAYTPPGLVGNSAAYCLIEIESGVRLYSSGVTFAPVSATTSATGTSVDTITATLSGLTAGSLLLGVVGSRAASGAVAPAGAGWTELDEVLGTGTTGTSGGLQIQYATDITKTTVSSTASGTRTWGLLAVEILRAVPTGTVNGTLLTESGTRLALEDGTGVLLDQGDFDTLKEQFDAWRRNAPVLSLPPTNGRIGLESDLGALLTEDGAAVLFADAPHLTLENPGGTAGLLLEDGSGAILAQDGGVLLPEATASVGGLLLEDGSGLLISEGTGQVLGGEQFETWRSAAPVLALGDELASSTTAALTTAGLSASATATAVLAITGTAALTTAGLSVAATSAEVFTETAALTTAGLSVAATASEVFTGTAAATTAGLSVAATAAEVFTGTATLTTAGLSVAATDAEVFTGTAALTTAGLSVAATAAESFPATAALTTAGLSVGATATEAFPSAAALTTAGLSVAAEALSYSATAALTTAGLSVDAASSTYMDTTASLTTAGLSVEAAAAETFAADAALTTAGLSVAAEANRTSPDAEVTCTVAGLSVDASVAEAFETSAALSIGGLSAAGAVEVPQDAPFPGAGSKSRPRRQGVTWGVGYPNPPAAAVSLTAACAVGGLGCEIAMSTRWRFEAATITDDELRELVELVGA